MNFFLYIYSKKYILLRYFNLLTADNVGYIASFNYKYMNEHIREIINLKNLKNIETKKKYSIQ